MANPYHTATIPLCHQEPNHAAQPLESLHMCRFGQNPIYTVYIRYFWQGNHRIYGHIRCIYTVLANPTYVLKFCTTNVATPHCTSSTSSAGRPAAGTLLKSLLTRVCFCITSHTTQPLQLNLQASQRQGRCSKAYLRVCFCITSHTTQPHQLNLVASQRQGRCSKAYLRVCYAQRVTPLNLTN